MAVESLYICTLNETGLTSNIFLNEAFNSQQESWF